MTNIDSKQRFSDRVENYVNYRPDYPREILSLLKDRVGLTPAWTIADIGIGTGISSRLFLENGNEVIGVEPNAAMRIAAEKMLAKYPKFKSIDASAEATSLANASVDLVVAGQSFHWFDYAACKDEFRRILKWGGWCVLFWNKRLDSGSQFLEEYQSLLEQYGTDYAAVRHEKINAEVLGEFFSPAGYASADFPNQQQFDLKGLIGRCLSSSYAPAVGHPNHDPLLDGLRSIFAQYQHEGVVAFGYQTQLHFGKFDVP